MGGVRAWCVLGALAVSVGGHKLSMYKWVQQKLNYDDAFANCKELGGRLAGYENPSAITSIYSVYVDANSCAAIWIDGDNEEAIENNARRGELGQSMCLMHTDDYGIPPCAPYGRQCAYGLRDAPSWAAEGGDRRVTCDERLSSICTYPPSEDNHDHVTEYDGYRGIKKVVGNELSGDGVSYRRRLSSEGLDIADVAGVEFGGRLLQSGVGGDLNWEGWLAYGGTYFQAIGNSPSFAQCMENCACAGGALACPRDKGTNTFLTYTVKPRGAANGWIGLTTAYATKNEPWTCVADRGVSTLLAGKPTYLNFDGSGEGRDGELNCAAIDESGNWADEACDGNRAGDYACLCEFGVETKDKYVYAFEDELLKWADKHGSLEVSSTERETKAKSYPCCTGCQEDCEDEGTCGDYGHTIIIGSETFGICVEAKNARDGLPCALGCPPGGDPSDWSRVEFEEVRLMPPREPCAFGWALPATHEACAAALAMVGRDAARIGPLEASTPTCGYSLSDDGAGAFARDTPCEEDETKDWGDTAAVCVPCDDCEGVGTRCARLRNAGPDGYEYASPIGDTKKQPRAVVVGGSSDDESISGLSKKSSDPACDISCVLLIGVIVSLLILTFCTCAGNMVLTKERRKFAPRRSGRVPQASWSDIELQDAHAIPAEAVSVTEIMPVGESSLDTTNDAAIAAAMQRRFSQEDAAASTEETADAERRTGEAPDGAEPVVAEAAEPPPVAIVTAQAIQEPDLLPDLPI